MFLAAMEDDQERRRVLLHVENIWSLCSSGKNLFRCLELDNLPILVDVALFTSLIVTKFCNFQISAYPLDSL